jgi:hypothetical protein
MSTLHDALGMEQEVESNSPTEGSRKKGWLLYGVAAIGFILLLALLLSPSSNGLFGPNPTVHKTKAAMKDVWIALGHFRTEYASFPVNGPYTRKDVELRSEGPLLAAILADDPQWNPRGIKFLDMPMARDGKFGLLQESGQWQMVDPWGEKYYMALDVNMDHQIANPEAKPGNLSERIPAAVNASVIMYSSGPDRDPKTWEDNVRSWR